MCTLGLSHFMRGKGISNKAVGRSVDLGEVRKNRRSFSKTDLASISFKICVWVGGGGALCVEMGFYVDISWESRWNIEIKV